MLQPLNWPAERLGSMTTLPRKRPSPASTTRSTSARCSVPVATAERARADWLADVATPPPGMLAGSGGGIGSFTDG
jgi:hypothetical protein